MGVTRFKRNGNWNRDDGRGRHEVYTPDTINFVFATIEQHHTIFRDSNYVYCTTDDTLDTIHTYDRNDSYAHDTITLDTAVSSDIKDIDISGGYLYLISNTILYKYTSSGTYVTELDVSSLSNAGVTYLSPYLYVNYNTTLSYVDTALSTRTSIGSGMSAVFKYTNDGTYLYGYVGPGNAIWKIDPSDASLDATYSTIIDTLWGIQYISEKTWWMCGADGVYEVYTNEI